MTDPRASDYEDHYETWRRLMRQTGSSNRAQALMALNSLAAAEDLSPPAVVFCQSPFQLSLMPSILNNVLCTPAWSDARSRFQKADWDAERMRQEWKITWHQIWDDHLEPHITTVLLNDYQDFGDYAQLVRPLAETVESELRSQLFNPKRSLSKLEQKNQPVANIEPNSERWWRRAFGSPSGAERINRLMSELGKLYGHNPSVRGSVSNELIADFWRLNLATQRCEANMRTIGGSLGKRPGLQLIGCVWLPFALHWVPGFLAIDEIAELDKAPRNVVRFRQQKETSALMRPWWQLTNAAGAVLFSDDICFVCDRATSMTTDDQGLLHNATGPAVIYSDGFSRYIWRGTVIPASLIEHPERVTIDTIDREENVEMRRVLADIYGFSRYLIDSNAEVVHQDACGVLYRKQMGPGEPLTMVKVVNSTAEPDGSHREYFLRVPPNMQRARQAVAWTFGLPEDEYLPTTES